MAEQHGTTRRNLMKGLGVAAVIGAATPLPAARVPRKQRIRHSVCKWCYGRIPLDDFAAACRDMGIRSIELMRPKDFATLKKHGLICAMTSTHGLGKGLNDPANHAGCLQAIREAIDATSAEGWPNVITFSGNRQPGVSDEEGLEHCATALRQVVPYAEQKKVTINMELLNSKVDHQGYMCDRTAWGVELCERVGSDRFKLLYDIYHMQIMEGDLIRTIRDHHAHIGHYHTGGNPGRHEIDGTQEITYPAVMKAIADTGFQGWVAQEFVPSRDPLTSLRESIDLCDV